MEKYVKKLAVVTMDFIKSCGRMLEQEYLRFIAMLRRRGTVEEEDEEEGFTEVSWNTRL